MSGLRGEVVLVTGGSSGIGLAAAHAFAAEGARVILAARDRQRLEAAARAVGGATRTLPVDTTDAASVAALARAVEETEGRLDVLVNCAGQLEIGPAEESGPELAERLIRANYLGVVNVVHAFLPLLRKGKRRSIVNVSSMAGKIAPPYMAAYSASKFALNGYTHALRQELRGEGFHLALVSPGPVDTPMTEGRLRTRYYPLLPGVKVVTAGVAARAVVQAVKRRATEVIVPRRYSLLVRLGLAFPGIVDRVYRPLMRR
jgi:short-subunit dehydrogenase